MAVSRRLRYEILRRDNHQCRYCGATAPEAKLTVDHVVPRALGGSDDPSNLVAACKDCNAGKSSSNPDQPLVDDVNADALRWGRAMQAAAAQRLADRRALDEIVDHFDHLWSDWWVGPQDCPPEERTPVPRDRDWRSSVRRFAEAGLEMETIAAHLRDAMECEIVKAQHTWRSFCRRCWDEINARQELARGLVDQETASPVNALVSAVRERWAEISEEDAIYSAERAAFDFQRAMELWVGGSIDDDALVIRSLIETLPDVRADAEEPGLGGRIAAQALVRNGVLLNRLVLEPT